MYPLRDITDIVNNNNNNKNLKWALNFSILVKTLTTTAHIV